MLIASILIALTPPPEVVPLDTGAVVSLEQIDKVVNRYCELSPTNTVLELQQKLRPGVDGILGASRLANRILADQGKIALKEETRRYVSDTVQVGDMVRKRAASQCPGS